MLVDTPFKSERQMEDYFLANPGMVSVSPYYERKVDRWIERQVSLPFGVMDILGISGKNIVVVELKNDLIKHSTLTQIERYRTDVRDVVENIEELSHVVLAVAIGIGFPSDSVLLDASQMGITILSIYRKGKEQEGYNLATLKQEYNKAQGATLDRLEFIISKSIHTVYQ